MQRHVWSFTDSTNFYKLFQPDVALNSVRVRACVCVYTQKNGAVSKINKKFISHLTLAQRTPSAAATVRVSHALPVGHFSCLLRGQFPRWRRSRKRLSVSSVLRCPDLWLQCSVSFVHRLEKAHHAGRNKFLVNFWTRTILLCTPCI